jgi:hypothetical protein
VKINKKISGVALSSISRSKLLGLCLYYIESEFHYTVDGIWSESVLNIHDNFPTTLPEFPKTLIKSYKYGVKLAGEHKLEPSESSVLL